MRRPVHLRHGRVRVIREDLGVLRPLKLVQQLGAQHHIEVLLYSRHHLINSILPDTDKTFTFRAGHRKELRNGD